MLSQLFRIREVPILNLGLQNGKPEWGLSRFYSASPDNFWNNALNNVTVISFPLNLNSQIIPAFDATRHMQLRK
jgi:hypothetical protein